MQVQNFNFDLTNGLVSVAFGEPEEGTFGSIQFKIQIEKSETIEQLEKAAKQKLAEVLDKAAKAMNEHQG